MFNPFPEEPAKTYAFSFMNELESKNLMADFTGMFGILVCRKKSENQNPCEEPIEGSSAYDEKNAGNENSTGNESSTGNEQVVLKAFSGQYKSRWNYEGFVNALVDQKLYDKAVEGNDREIHRLSESPEGESPEQKQLRDEKRLALCNETLEKIYSLYNFTCFDGVTRNFDYLKEQVRYNSNLVEAKLLPTGTGDCCAPKLLSYAFSHNLEPVSLVEFYWGKPNSHFENKKFYPPCDEKCGLILPEILGLKILYRDEDIIVVNKPSGLLAVPGRGPDKQDCIVNRIKNLFPDCIEQPSAHRLDMDTSGLLVLGFTTEAQRSLSIQFQNGEVEKKYIAVIDGVLGVKCNFENHAAEKLSPKGLKDLNPQITPETNEGKIELKCRLDIENRPHQIYDEVYGKNGITLWKKIRIWKMNGRNVTSIEFNPQTGRTHQLRLAAASCIGFGIPIVGDNLYGHQEEGQRLLLHSSYLSFKHPVTGEKMEFFCEPDFKY